MRFKPISVNIAVMDYGAAVASAVAWLGSRYLLATPARRLTQDESNTSCAKVPLVRNPGGHALHRPVNRSRPSAQSAS
jgi:hypothetical protein